MYPYSYSGYLNTGLHYMFPNLYKQMDDEFELGTLDSGYDYGIYNGEGRNNFTFVKDKLDKDDFDNKLPTLIIHGSDQSCNHTMI